MKYKIIRKIISKELSSFLFNYLDLRADTVKYLYDQKLVEPNKWFGFFGDGQIAGNHYAQYGDFAMETLLTMVQPILEKAAGKKLIPTYAFTRMYFKGSEMYRHKDRVSCEISATLNLGGDLWPIYIDTTGENNIIKPPSKGIIGSVDVDPPVIHKKANKGKEIKLNPGDLMLYEGHKYEHWRNKFKGSKCGQVFLHYNYKDGPIGIGHKYDKRPKLGIVR
jgi:hypothetical protein